MESSLDLMPLLEPIAPDLAQVERLLQERLGAAEGPLGPALQGMLRGGKRLRPALVILAGRMLDASGAEFHRLAAALDVLHAATLIHDDLVDGAPLRRGREALHTVWPAEAAVLAGDYLLAEAIALLAEVGQPRLLGLFAGALRTLCAGEIREALAPQRGDVSREGYYRGIRAKTASLFAAAAEMAGILAGAGERRVAGLRRFGLELGIAFQIADDVLDVNGDEAALGKPPGGDLRQGLATLPILCYLERAPGDSPVRAVLAGRRDEAQVQAALEVVRTSGAAGAALDEAHAHIRCAQEALAPLPANRYRDTLHGLAEYAVRRRY
jgi:octaprenyl-diphosphate synthase